MKVNFKIVRSWSGVNPNGKGFWCFVGDTVDIKLYNIHMIPMSIRPHYPNKIVRLKITNITESQIKGVLVSQEDKERGKNIQIIIRPDDVIWINVIHFVKTHDNMFPKKENVS